MSDREVSTSADEIIEVLDLVPHPEGGYFRETFRDDLDGSGRAKSTAIYFLLKENEMSRWHRVDAAEVWHWYAGSPLRLSYCNEELIEMCANGQAESIILGNNLAGGEVPQFVVPAMVWQSAESLGSWTLVGCTVAPGFEFSGFELAPDK